MDKTSYVVEVQYTKQGGTYSAMLISDYGDIYQQYTSYDESTHTATGISPSFEGGSDSKPIIELAIFNSKTAGGESYPNKVTWSVINTELTFGADGLSTNVFNGETGHFKRIDTDFKTKRAGLQIVKNVVVASQATPFSIVAKAQVANGMSSANVTATTTVGIRQAVVSAATVNITATNGGLVSASDTKLASTTLTAKVNVAEGAAVTSGFQYQWWASNNDTGVMEALPGKTAKTLVVTPADVNQSRLYMVKVTANNSAVGQDTQTVRDISDPLRIIPNPTPEDEQIIEGDATHDRVEWTPEVYMGDTKVADSKVSWKFQVYDCVGAPVYDTPITTVSQFVVDEETVANNGNVQVVITASVEL